MEETEYWGKNRSPQSRKERKVLKPSATGWADVIQAGRNSFNAEAQRSQRLKINIANTLKGQNDKAWGLNPRRIEQKGYAP